MPTDPSDRPEGRGALELLVGEWTEQVLLPDIPPGRVVFEWALGGHYLIQRSDIPQPEFPDSIVIIACDGDTDSYTLHYFDSRGIVRIYQMSLSEGLDAAARQAGLHAARVRAALRGNILRRRQHHRCAVGDLARRRCELGA